MKLDFDLLRLGTKIGIQTYILLCGCQAIRVINWDEFLFFLFLSFFFRHGSRKL